MELKKVSYAILACDEENEFYSLMRHLKKYLDFERNDVNVLIDSAKYTQRIIDIVKEFDVQNYYFRPCGDNITNQKNHLLSLCKQEYVFFVDADEIPNEFLIENLNLILTENPEIDVIGVPRINIVDGLTPEHVAKWKWVVDERGYVNFPDYQYRIFKNNGKIYYGRKVHHSIHGYETISVFPAEDRYCLYHRKSIERQEKQAKFYETVAPEECWHLYV